MLSLDYDRVDADFITRELFRLKHKFNLEFSLYASSQSSYHIRFNHSLEKKKAFEILNYSRCSKDYKEFCKRVGMFPIREGEKTKYSPNGDVKVKPAPKRLFTF